MTKLAPALGHAVYIYVRGTGGGTNWTTIAAIIAGAIATIAAALVSARIVSRTTFQTLEAEDRRLQERLRFERGETDRAELRTILDRLGEQLTKLYTLTNRASSMAIAAALTENMSSNDALGYEAIFAEIASEVDGPGDLATELLERLRLRLRDEGQVLVTHALACQMAVQLMLAHIEAFDFSEEHARFLAEDNANAREARLEFVQEALNFTESQLYRPGEPSA